MVEHSYPPDSHLKSWSHSGTSCNNSLRNSSSYSFLFVFSVSTDPRDGYPRNSSLVVSLLSVAGFSLLITVSYDEDVDEAGEDEVEELTRDNELYVVLYIAIDSFAMLGEMWVFDHWSSGKYTHDPRRASREKELLLFLQKASRSRISPILKHFPWLLLLFAPRRCPSSPSSDSSIS